MRFSSVLFCQPGATQSRKYTANFDGDRIRDGMHTVLCERVNPQWYAMLGITFHRGICVGAQLSCLCSVVVLLLLFIGIHFPNSHSQPLGEGANEETEQPQLIRVFCSPGRRESFERKAARRLLSLSGAISFHLTTSKRRG